MLNPAEGRFGYRHLPLFVSFAVATKDSGAKIEIPVCKRDRLGDAKSGGINKFEQGTVAQAFFSCDVRSLEKPHVLLL